jgi:carbohydrate kinase (thermoresistant glucokinase family)
MAEKPTEVTSTALAATPMESQGGVADVRPILIVAGVSGSGKTTIATALAQRLGLPFAEGGQLHPSPNIAKVHTAHPLDDRHWWSWLEKIAAWIDGCRQLGTGGVITSPVLRRSHRDFLTRGRPDARIVYLHGERALIASRLAAREEHSTLLILLDHQFSILEEPEPDEDPILIDVSRPVEDIVAEILRTLIAQVRENPSEIVGRDSSERPAPPRVTPFGPHSHPSTGTVAVRRPFIGSDLPLDIEDYALIGDCTTAALVGRNGSIDWLCWPRFDSNALFSALLGTSEHGRWRISPADPTLRTSRAYHDDTLVLDTVFDTANGSVALIDFMPMGQTGSSVIRLVKGRRGKVAMQMHLALRFDYGVTVPWVTKLEEGSGERGFNSERNTFTQSFGSGELDASLLLIPLVGFLPADDPRVRSTVATIERELMVDGLVLRYRTESDIDGLTPGEGVFLPCSFWLANNYKLQHRDAEARALFERLLSLRNDVGLLAEEYDPRAKRQLGNFPQAFSHLALIGTALSLHDVGPAQQRSRGAKPGS